MNLDLHTLLQRSGGADQYFFSREVSYLADSGSGKRLSLQKGRRIQSAIGGVRLHEWSPPSPDAPSGEQCQHDLARSVGALVALRKQEPFQHTLISHEFSSTRQAHNRRGRRVKFGLAFPESSAFADDTRAAMVSHANIRRAIRKSGFAVESPTSFDPSTGLVGLQDWAQQVKLRRKKSWWPWLLLLLLPLLALFLPRCDTVPDVAGLPALDTKSFILLIDRSNSMAPAIETARRNFQQLLESLNKKRNPFAKYYVDVISYDAAAHSALGGMTQLDPSVALSLNDYLGNLSATGDTNLESAIRLAAKEVAAHGKPTTLLIITDAQDISIPGLVRNVDQVRGLFQGVEVHVNSNTPRIIDLNPTGNIPITAEENDLRTFSNLLDGTFGPRGIRK